MKKLTLVISVFCVLLFAGCSKVVSKYPMGTDPYVASSAEWEGTWMCEDGFIKIKVLDQAKGIIKLAWIEEKDNDFKLETMTCQIKKGKDGLYLSAEKVPGEDSGGFYFWGKVRKERNIILFWQPEVEAFNEAVTAGKLHAIIEKSDPDKSGKQEVRQIMLLDKPRVVLDLIEKNSRKYFDLENPIVLTKLQVKN